MMDFLGGFSKTLFLLGGLSVACYSESPPEPRERAVSIETVGDTILVVDSTFIVGGRSFRGLRRVERIGSLDGTEGPIFGRIGPVDRDDEGRWYVTDVLAETVWQVDAGKVTELTRKGQGPGEVMRLGGVVTLGDGRVLIADRRNKFLVLRDDGTLIEEWKTELDFLSSRPLVRKGDGSFLVRQRLGSPGRQEELPLGYVRISTVDGSISDTISVPATPFGEEARWGLLQPKRLAAVHPGVGVLGAVTSRYLIDIRKDGGKIARMHYDAEPISFHSVEKEENELIVDWYRGRGWRDPSKQRDPPADKQLLRGLEVASDGKI